MKNTILLIAIAILSIASSYAELKLPAIFGDNMVLQQKSDVKFWGTAEENSTITVSTTWSKKKYKTESDENGEWSLRIPSIAADHKAHTVTIKQGRDKIAYSNVMLGEVWLCSGQSNMALKMKGAYMSGITGSAEAILNANNPELRLFDVTPSYKLDPQTDFEGKWEVASPESVSDFTAAGYFFGAQLQKSLGVPVALISAAWGGANIITFMSSDAIAKFPSIKPISEIDETVRQGPQRYASLVYNGMIKPLVGYNIAGCVWYQGESNRAWPDTYVGLLTAMLADWRESWGCGDFYFHQAEIAPYGDYPKVDNVAIMREKQLDATKVNKNCHIISLIDAGEKHEIHPSNKKIVGTRLAMSALQHCYKIGGITSEAPHFKSMGVGKDGKIYITFDSPTIDNPHKEVRGFEVAGADKVFYPAKVESISGRGVVALSCDKVEKPVAVRYLYHSWVDHVDLYGMCGNPITSFRTDDWKL